MISILEWNVYNFLSNVKARGGKNLIVIIKLIIFKFAFFFAHSLNEVFSDSSGFKKHTDNE